MSARDVGSPPAALPVAPSLGPSLEGLRAPPRDAIAPGRLLLVSGLAVGLGAASTAVARLLLWLIAGVTNLAFFGRLSTAPASPADAHLGLLVLVIPPLGGIVVGLMARYGSPGIRGHGIPEAMEQVLFHRSRIPPRLTFLKPTSAAIAIGTGGPFGAEGPIIATGGALGSLLGQLLPVTASERKTLLAAGAAAGMAAIFATPVSAVLLAIELLLFEYRSRSVIPVALAAVTATAARGLLLGPGPVFPMPALAPPGAAAIASYVAIGALVGLLAVAATRAVYAVEDAFERVPLHWMWWPAIGAIVVGAVGLVAPRTLGVGYDNIDDLLSARLVGTAAFTLCALKFLSWSVALGSGTSGGTLAPLFTVGGGAGALLGALAAAAFPQAGIDPRIGALVGMAAIFAGASHALLASIVFAFEATRQPLGLLPLLGGCTAAFLVSILLMRTSIMTEKITRRGARVPSDYVADHLAQVLVRDRALRPVVTLRAGQRVSEVLAWMRAGAEGSRHQGFPVVDDAERIVGVVTRADLLLAPGDPPLLELVRRAPAVTFEDSTLREAADHMVREGVGRLPVVARDDPRRIVGILTRGGGGPLVTRRAGLPRATHAQATYANPKLGTRWSNRAPATLSQPSRGFARGTRNDSPGSRSRWPYGSAGRRIACASWS